MRRATLYTIIAAVLWGTSFPAITVGLKDAGASPFTFAALRFVIGAGLLVFFALATRRPLATHLATWPVWGLGFLNAAGYALQFLGQNETSASKASLLVDIDVVFIALLGAWLLHERHGANVWIALGLGLIGVVLLSTNADPSAMAFSNREFRADALVFSAGLLWALSFVGTKALIDRLPGVDNVALAAAIVGATATFLAPLALASDGLAGAGEPLAWLLAAYLGVGPTVAFVLWQEALRTEGVTTTSILLLLEIVVAVAIGVVFLGERLGTWAIMGAALVVAATVLASRGSAAPAPTPEPAAGQA